VIAGHGPCWEFLSEWWCIHKQITFYIWQGAETKCEVACNSSTSRGKTQRLHSVLCKKCAKQEEGNNLHL
jgi:hypothetical protein